jgi:phenylacetate-CoA ligase
MVLAAPKICSFYPMMHENSAGQPNASEAPVSLAQKFYDTLMAMQFASKTSLALFQENVLKDLIEAVAAESAFYRPRLAPVLDAKGKADLALWHKIPILTQADVAAHADRLRTTAIPKAHGRIFRYQSSGTTGWSIAYSRSELADLAITCGQHRHLTAMNIDWSRDIALIRAFDPALTRFRRRPEEPLRKDSWGPGWLAPENLGVVHRLSVFTPIEEQLAWLASLGPVYLNTFPSNALALARHVRKNPRAKPKLFAILTAGEPITADVRREVEAHLDCSCRDLISNAEFGLIASQCPAGKGYHLQSELARIELLDLRNRPVKPGQWARVVITPLYNFAMPLIRFDTGDLAELRAGGCSCGRQHPLIGAVYGRKSNLLRAGKWAWMRPDLRSEEIEAHLPGCRWQMVQTSARKAELRYMRLTKNAVVDEVGVLSHASEALGPGISIVVREVAALGASASGKFPCFVSQVKD